MAERIAERLEQVLDMLEGGQFSSLATRGLAYGGGPDRPEIALSVADLARIVAEVVDVASAEDDGRA